MLFVKHLIYFLYLHLVIASPQLNLHLTDLITENPDDIPLQHNCLYVAHSTEKPSSYEISSYCLSESPSKWNIVRNQLDPIFTFAELKNQNITSEHLYNWSVPMDITERYQFYLMLLSISNESSTLERELIFNCTYPNFGPVCQYSLDISEDPKLSLKEILDNYYIGSYEPETLTCYTNLQCNRGPSPACLDWSEICDGKVDCLDNGIDEEFCWQLNINQCKDDEYRCDNGQCIPKTFVNDGFPTFDCLDRSDEYENSSIPSRYKSGLPTIENEDIICSWRGEHMNNFLTNSFTSSCVDQRHSILEQAIFSRVSNEISNDCFLAFKCHSNIPTFDNPLCSNFCQNETCIDMIENTCPEIFFYPNVPIAYGHIYFAYTKQYAINWKSTRQMPPEYICYNEQFCGGFYPNRTVLFYGQTCRRPEDFPVYFGINENAYIRELFVQLSHCNRISMICNNSTMYQCKNSSKCIPNYSIGDGIRDCDYHDDEEQITIDKICLLDQSNIFFRCQTENKCIHRNNIENGICDCQEDENNLCDDENLQLNQIKRTIKYSTICDSFIDLLPILIDGQNQTDETNCEYWPCNNTYTHCDGLWNCFDGSDEVDCNSSPLINCLPHHHICVSIQTDQLICLPLDRVNNGIIDCLGGIDEPSACPLIDRYDKKKFYCTSQGQQVCLSEKNLCDGIADCENVDDERFCDNLTIVTMFKNYFHGQKTARLLLDKSKQIDSLIVDPYCHRGIPLRVRLDPETDLFTRTCLCPSSYYGDRCQYQNERVSLTLQLNTTSYTPFILVISLIDDSIQRIIHSYEQIMYFHMKDQYTKFNLNLFYSTRPKDRSKTYAIHIDIYDRTYLYHRESLLIPLKFPFLPVERIAVQLNITHPQNIINTCNNRQCIHGQCIQYLNDPTITFCQCHPGWSGQYCNISHTCKCSADSLCAGVAANGRSICVCSMNKFGSQCFLNNNICQSNSSYICLNGGMCISSDEYTASRYPFVCICPKGFTGDRCEIADTKMILSFSRDIVLSKPTLIFFHFIHLINNTLPIQNKNPRITCQNETSVISYSSNPFNIAFIELSSFQYYLFLISQTVVHQSFVIAKTITSLDRCQSINEIFNESISRMHLIQRIKYYQIPCQSPTLNLSCFFDDVHMCLCQDDGNQRFANCFEFNHHMKIDDLNLYYQEIERECHIDYLFNSSTSPFSPTSSTSPSSPTSSTQTTTNDISSIYASEYFLYLFILLFCFI